MPSGLQNLLRSSVLAAAMETHIQVPHKHIDAFCHAFFRQDDKLACAPLLAGGTVDWDSWTILEESPEANREHMKRICLTSDSIRLPSRTSSPESIGTEPWR